MVTAIAAEPVTASADERPKRASRAAALPADERRAAIIEATIPLVLEQGTAVTTRSIAIAAGIAEGTIFRVFADKDSLIEAVVDAVFDPAPTEAALAEVDMSLPFEERLAAGVQIVQRRLTDIWRVTSAIGGHREGKRPHSTWDLAGLAALFEPERDRLAFDPMDAGRMLRGITLAMSHPALVNDSPMSPRAIVSLLLDGIRSR